VLNFIIERGEVGCGVVVVHAVWWLSPRRTGAVCRLTDSPNDLLSEPALEMGDRPPQERLTDFACDAFHRIDGISGGACRSGVGYPIITSIPRALVVVRTCRSALNMLKVSEWRVGLLCYISVNASCRSCSSGCSHAQPQHKSSNSALYSARYYISESVG
jgi:hypothetical protein